MEKETATSIKVGAFVILGVACLVAGIYFIGNKKNLFSSNLHIKALFKNVSGLQRGNNVRFSGINVGTVDNIVIVNDSVIEVNMTIEKRSAEFIRTDATASIGTDGLMGSRLVNIGSGSASSRAVRNGDIIRGLDPVQIAEMLQVLGESNKNISGITSDIKKITTEIHSGKGPVWKLLADSTLAGRLDAAITYFERTSANTERMTKSFADMADGVKRGDGGLGKLLADTAIENKMEVTINDLAKASNDLSLVSGQIKNGKGALGAILSDSSAMHIMRSLENIEEGTSRFNENMEALKHNFLFRKYYKNKKKK